jgi:diguanylate cyclase (GGDEF)-like protein
MLLRPVRLGPAAAPTDLAALSEAVFELIAASIRDTDLLGGLEDGTFALLMPRTAARNALIAAHRINSKIGSRPFMHSGEAFALQLTVGVAGVAEEVTSGMELLAHAEQALEEASAAGPGCSFIYV